MRLILLLIGLLFISSGVSYAEELAELKQESRRTDLPFMSCQGIIGHSSPVSDETWRAVAIGIKRKILKKNANTLGVLNGESHYQIICTVSLKSDGQIENLAMTQSSGNKKIDDYVITLISNASPFQMEAHQTAGNFRLVFFDFPNFQNSDLYVKHVWQTSNL